MKDEITELKQRVAYLEDRCSMLTDLINEDAAEETKRRIEAIIAASNSNR